MKLLATQLNSTQLIRFTLLSRSIATLDAGSKTVPRLKLGLIAPPTSVASQVYAVFPTLEMANAAADWFRGYLLP